MSDAVTELTTDEKTKGRLNAFRQMLDDIEQKTVELKHGINYNEGARKAATIISGRIEGMIKQIIERAREGKEQMDVAEVQMRRDLLNQVRTQVEIIGQDFLKEHLMLKGEARSLQKQAQSVRALYERSQGESRRKEATASETRQAREDRETRQDEHRRKKLVKNMEEEKKKEEKKRKRSESAKKAAETRKKNAKKAKRGNG